MSQGERSCVHYGCCDVYIERLCNVNCINYIDDGETEHDTLDNSILFKTLGDKNET